MSTNMSVIYNRYIFLQMCRSNIFWSHIQVKNPTKVVGVYLDSDSLRMLPPKSKCSVSWADSNDEFIGTIEMIYATKLRGNSVASHTKTWKISDIWAHKCYLWQNRFKRAACLWYFFCVCVEPCAVVRQSGESATNIKTDPKSWFTGWERGSIRRSIYR